jgi:amidophosphoribosyltransferase
MACGVFGVYDVSGEPVSPYIYWGLKALNHRGHQSYRLVTYDGLFHQLGDLGLVPPLDQILSRREASNLSQLLSGSVGVGNVRYSTFGKVDGDSLVKDNQPLYISDNHIDLAISYNGNIVNVDRIKEEAESRYGPLQTTADTELIAKKLLMELQGKGIFSAVGECIKQLEGAFSIVGIKDGTLFAFRDSYGIRPLCYGKSGDGLVHCFASETPALKINGLEFDSFVEPGECVVVGKEGVTREQVVESKKKSYCSFELTYFSRPDSMLPNGRYVYDVREGFGRNLANENRDVVKLIELVAPLPESAEDAAYGFHEETGLRLERAMRRHRFVTDRAFMKSKMDRAQTIRKKMNIIGDRLNGKIVGVIDDSIVRGDTTRNTIGEIKRYAKEVHLFVTFPKITSPCPYGIDMATFEELIGARKSTEGIREEIGADSLHYQELGDFIKASGFSEDTLCLGCITGSYPTPYADAMICKAHERYRNGIHESGRVYEQDQG